MALPMNAIRILLSSLLLWSAMPAGAAENDEWAVFDRMVAVVRPLLRLAIESDDPRAVGKRIDSALAGEDAEVNRLARELAEEMFDGLPRQRRETLAALARDAATLARKERARSADDSIPPERSLQARKDLAAIGLRYYDAQQFLDAVKRDDTLAVELYVVGRGVNLAARDADGRSALEIARGSRNRAIVRLLETAG